MNLKKLIEDTYAKNGNQSVMLIAHSMGAPMTLHFLNAQSQNWKDKYIKCLVTLSGAWGGSAKAIKVYAIGKKKSLLEQRLAIVDQLSLCTLIFTKSVKT